MTIGVEHPEAGPDNESRRDFLFVAAGAMAVVGAIGCYLVFGRW